MESNLEYYRWMMNTYLNQYMNAQEHGSRFQEEWLYYYKMYNDLFNKELAK